jgi:hypothetical protein
VNKYGTPLVEWKLPTNFDVSFEIVSKIPDCCLHLLFAVHRKKVIYLIICS